MQKMAVAAERGVGGEVAGRDLRLAIAAGGEERGGALEARRGVEGAVGLVEGGGEGGEGLVAVGAEGFRGLL